MMLANLILIQHPKYSVIKILHAFIAILTIAVIPLFAFNDLFISSSVFLILSAILGILFLPNYRISILLLFCFIFPRNIEMAGGWQFTLLERIPEVDHIFQIGIVPFDGILLLAFVTIIVSKLIKREKVNYYAQGWGLRVFALFLLSALFAWSFNPTSSESALAGIWALSRAALIWLTLCNGADSAVTRRNFSWSIIGCGAFIALGGIVRYLTAPSDTLAEQWSERASSFGLGTGTLGAVGMMIGLFSLALYCYHKSTNLRLSGLFLFFISFTAVCLTFSRAPFVIISIISLVMLLRKSKSAFVIGLTALSVTIFMAFSAGDSNGRLAILQAGTILEENLRADQYHASLDMIADYPILGVGLMGYYDAAPKYSPISMNKRLIHSHSLALNIAVETGLIGLFTFIMFLANLLKNGWKRLTINDNYSVWRKAAFIATIGMLGSQALDYLFWDYRFVVLAFALLAMTQWGKLSSYSASER